MSAPESREQLALADALTQRTQTLCQHLEDGVADIFDLVTPTTAALLHWWFGREMVTARGHLNFHPGQQQAILNAIVAHEVIGAATLKSLYEQVVPDALLAGKRLAEVSEAKHAHPKYCLKMATGTGKTRVLQALLIWQLLNRSAQQAAGGVDGRFTRNFLIVAPGLIVYERLLDAFLGKERDGARDFATCDVAKFADLFIPEAAREAVFGFVRGNTCRKEEIGLKATGNGLLAICNWHLLSDAPEEASDEKSPPEMSAPGALSDPQAIIAGLLPLTPGRRRGTASTCSTAAGRAATCWPIWPNCPT